MRHSIWTAPLRLDRLYDAVERSSLSLDDLAPRIKKLKADKDSLQARKYELEWHMKERKLELADITTVARYAQDLRSLLNESPLAERESFIRSFVKEVMVTGNRVLLNYTIPLPLNGLVTKETRFCLPYTLVGHCGLEPQTPVLSGPCSNQLS